MNFRRKHYRFTDVVAAICIPATVILTFYVGSLTRDLQAITSSYVVLNDLPSGKTSGEETNSAGTSEDQNYLETFSPIIPIQAKNDDQIMVAPPLNNTGKGTGDILILTAIPRSGQSTLREVLKELKILNHFLIITPPLKEKHVIDIPDRDKRKSIVDKVASLNGSNLIIDYFAFINFTEFGHKQPIQVSFVREPVERAISLYYFARAPHQVVERYRIFPSQKLPSRQFLRKSMEACLLDPKDAECNYDKDSEREGNMIQYFCGHESYCRLFANEKGFQRAKGNVKSNFAVVGILEELEKTLVVLEHYVPKFFKGAYETCFKKHKDRKPPNQNMYKPTLEKPFKRKLQLKLQMERKFYDFLRQRLNKQYEKVLQRSKISERLRSEKNDVL